MGTRSVKVLFISFLCVSIVSFVEQASSDKKTVNFLKKNDTEAEITKNGDVDQNSTNIDKEDWVAEFSDMIAYDYVKSMGKQELEELVKDDAKRLAKLQKILTLYPD